MTAAKIIQRKPFSLSDLAPFEELFSRASAVVSMREVFEGAKGASVIGLRHDVDHDLAMALEFGAWEAERGYRATYFLLHTAQYWHGGADGDKSFYREGWPSPTPELREAVPILTGFGHEIGFHNNAFASALVSGRGAAEILEHELGVLRELGAEVVGTAAHGDAVCYDLPGWHPDRRCLFTNYEMFTECAAPKRGAPDREIEVMRNRVPLRVALEPRPLSDFGLQYESIMLPHTLLISDSGGKARIGGRGKLTVEESWPERLEFPDEGQLHILLHPDWWQL